MDAYFDYNQIPMFVGDKDKTTFITNHANVKYNVLSFILINARATDQQMMSKIFKEEIGDIWCEILYG
jgi:hypothetical protein